MGRLRVVGVRVERAAGRAAVAVSLGHDGVEVTGRVERPAADAPAVQVAAEAALEAVRQVAPGRARLTLEQVSVQPLLRGQAVIIHVLLETEGASEHLIGSALSRTAPLEEAAAQAVLDAIERRLSWLMRT